MPRFASRGAAALCAALLASLPFGATHAQNYPEKPIRLVVGFSAGGPTDLPARFIADRLSTALKQRVVVENRVGAGGQIATQDVLSRPRDGYNLLLCTHFESINAAVYRNVAYKLSDLAPISQISRYYYGIVVTNELPVKTWEEFLRYARANPDRINYGSVGRGSAQEIMAREIGVLTGTRMQQISYKGGAQIMPDLYSGRVHFYVSPTLAVIPPHKAGKLRLLAVTSPERLAAVPDIPTVVEKGLDFVRFGWLGMCAGTGTPQPVIALLNRHIREVVASPEYRQMIEKAGSVPISSTPGELAQVLKETYEQTAAVVKRFDLQLD